MTFLSPSWRSLNLSKGVTFSPSQRGHKESPGRNNFCCIFFAPVKTLPETKPASLHLIMDGCFSRSFPFGMAQPGRCELLVSGRVGRCFFWGGKLVSQHGEACEPACLLNAYVC